MSEHYDVIIIGTGAGGGTLLNRLAPGGKRILVLERGPFLPREKSKWTYKGSFKYYSSEPMYNKEGNEIYPGMCYHIGGNTKVYGAALFRLREKDFESFQHQDGVSPEWRLKYRDFESYYDEAEDLYQVHGKVGEDPTEPPRKKDYPFPPISHEPRIKVVFETLKAKGLKPYPAPMAISRACRTKEIDARVCTHKVRANANERSAKAMAHEARSLKSANSHQSRVCMNRDLCIRPQHRLALCFPDSHSGALRPAP